MNKDHIKIVETVFTDSNERVLNNYMKTEEMLPILEAMDRVGYHAIEVFAGNLFESAFETLQDPWERLLAFRARVKNTKLLLTMQGARIFSDKLYPDAMVESFVEVCKENGISAFRLYDRDNALENIKTALQTAKKLGAEVQAAIVYQPEMTMETLAEKAKEAENLGADVIYLRDTAGFLTPYKTGEVFDTLSKAVSVPLGLEMHQTAGYAEMSYLKAVEHGCRMLDTTVSPLSTAVSHPATEVMTETFGTTAYAADVDRMQLQEVDDYFRKISETYQNRKIFGAEKMALNFCPVLETEDTDPKELLYDDLTEEDIRQIRKEIAAVEKHPLDAVTFALYPEETKSYLASR